MKIQEFAESRNLKVNTVHVYLNKHKEILEDCFRDGKYLCINEDSKGFELLCKKYPLPQPVNVIEDTESRKKLIVAQERMIWRWKYKKAGYVASFISPLQGSFLEIPLLYKLYYLIVQLKLF